MCSSSRLDAELQRGDDHWIGSFRAMASPCKVLVESDDRDLALQLVALAAREARRVEQKYSRYLDTGVVHAINKGDVAVEVDAETARLIDFADRLFHLSEARFDITSGVLRRAWRFDGSDAVPTAEEVDPIRERIGWSRVAWDGRTIRLQPGMEIDLGGIGKEYAVDQAARLIADESTVSCLVNFGGDLAISRERENGRAWRVGIEDPDQPHARRLLSLVRGALATSGDSRRFLLKDGVRYGHILDATTGWPVAGAPRSVTVAAGTCTEAGMAATLAMLRGCDAERFLESEGLPRWTVREESDGTPSHLG
jgi:thiamine biosynthesis lipoprotein